MPIMPHVLFRRGWLGFCSRIFSLRFLDRCKAGGIPYTRTRTYSMNSLFAHLSRSRFFRLAPLVALLGFAACRPRTPVAESGSGDRTPRIVSLAPSLTEILFAIGADGCVVGRTDVCNYPPEAAAVPVVGGFGKPSIEALAAQKPTHVLSVDLEDTSLPLLFTRLGWGSERIPCARLDDIPDAVLAVGRISGRTHAAVRLADEIRAGVAARRSTLGRSATPPSVLVLVWWEPLMTVGRPSFIADLVTLAGGRVITSEIDRDYFTVSEEWVLRQNPDVILSFGAAPSGETLGRLRGTTGWRTLQAVKDGRVYDAFDPDIVCRPGPRILMAADQIRAVLTDQPPP
jgi:iron complex transport system substrate-binding protein